MFVILQPLFFLKSTRIPLFFDGLPCIVYLPNLIRFLFLKVSSFDSHMWESKMILMSLSKSKKVFNFADSFFVPVLDPLRFVEVILILLADLVFLKLIVMCVF